MLYVVTATCVPCRAACLAAVLASICFNAEALAHIPSEARQLKNSQRSSDSFEKDESTWTASLNFSQVLMDSGKTSKSWKNQVQAIQGQLSAMQTADAQSIGKQKAEYEQQLIMQRAEITAAEDRNAHMMNETDKMRKTNKGLRRKASVLAEAAHKVRLDIIQMQNNATVAMDFMQQALKVSEDLLNATEIQVTKELDKQDELMQKRLAYVKHWKMLGMLQVGSEHKSVPVDSLQGMLSSLEDYAKQKAAHENSLKTMFERRFQAGSDQLKTLQKEYEELFATFEAEKKLEGRLVVAVQHVEKTYVDLVKKKKTLGKFFESLSPHSAVA